MKKIFGIIFIIALAFAGNAYARDNVTDWYIKDFKSQINVNKDSSLDITETIIADCGNNQKHGIFRILPTVQRFENEIQNTPVRLLSITNEAGEKIDYSATNDRINKTVTWKIGSKDKFVTGVNTYIIKYQVKNAIRNQNKNFDELYWNLNGNFWELETDKYEAIINFPEGLTKDNLDIFIYSGNYGGSNELDIRKEFISASSLRVYTEKKLDEKEGITLSASFPKNIITQYTPSFIEKYGSLFFILIPLAALFLCVKLWKKYGLDPKINPTIAPEFEIPENLTPIDMGVLKTDGILRSNFVTASIVNLAINGKLKIKKIERKGVFLPGDFELTRANSSHKLSQSEAKLYNSLFASGEKVNISELRNKFYTSLPKIRIESKKMLVEKNLLIENSRTPQYLMLALGIIGTFGSLSFFMLNTTLAVSSLTAFIIILSFSFFMPRRTQEGAELTRRVKGFELYLKTVEAYRQKILEKEHIFEKLLPYAIMFSMTNHFISKMKMIYGEEYFKSYHPAWFYYGSAGSFNVDSLTSEISSLSSSMTQTIASTPSSSGSGGGGFSGGGGGGGGGGGW